MKKLLASLILLFIVPMAMAQELNCMVTVNSQQIEGSDKSVYENLQKAIREFMNERKWTGYVYKIEERIECSILITLSERISNEEFKGTIQVQSRRPIFQSSYNSVMLNLLDKDFQFKYLESTPLDFDENSFQSNLTSVLAFYANLIIGLDFDSYSVYGGSPYYNKCQTIVNNAQNTADKGWKAYESKKNRYWIIENLLNKSYSPIRECLYLYHLKGLDAMKENVELGRAQITAGLEKVQMVNRDKPGLYLIQLFIDTKRDELINIYSNAPANDKPKIVNLLKEIDPAHSGDYNNKILNAAGIK
ncbi:MAG: DUF4835 family protein [Bacteroidota bacterium]